MDSQFRRDILFEAIYVVCDKCKNRDKGKNLDGMKMHKYQVMEGYYNCPANPIWELLNEKVQNIENKIKTVAEDLKKELHKDIEDSKK